MDTHKAAITGVVLVGIILSLMLSKVGADAVLLAGLVALLLFGVIDVKTALSGFSNEGMATVGALFVVSAALRQTGAMSRLAGVLLGRAQSVRGTLLRMTLPVAALSSVLNNTPIVAALTPAVTEWARRRQLPASKFLIPLSYATILGGTITVIGTSTNLVVVGLIEKNLATSPGLRHLGIFDIAGVGLPTAILGCLAIVALGPKLLPDRRPAVSKDDDPRVYSTELMLQEGSPLAGRSIEEAGLRNLPGAFLAELHRGEVVLGAVEPTTRLAAGDRLVFVGPREAVMDLLRLPGLVSAPDSGHVKERDDERILIEAVVAPQSPLLGRTIREGNFRSTYNAVVAAVARAGERVPGKIGDIELQLGDVLLLEAAPSWIEAWRDRPDFYLTSAVEDSAAFRHSKAPLALIILALMVLAAATELSTMFQASVVAAVALIATGCVAGSEARRSVEWSTLVSIAAAFGIGEGIRLSGADQALAQLIVQAGASTPVLALVAFYVGTAFLTELITNNAAAALMFPFALSIAASLGVSPMPFAVAVMFAASASFATPIGYQTNLMVYGPGGYRFTDFLRLGLPLQVVVGIVTLTTIPWFFPF
jgi:di/tricarboxylate transporter